MLHKSEFVKFSKMKHKNFINPTLLALEMNSRGGSGREAIPPLKFSDFLFINDLKV